MKGLLAITKPQGGQRRIVPEYTRCIAVCLCALLLVMLRAEAGSETLPQDSAGDQSLTVTGAYVRATLPGKNTAVAYLTVHNSDVQSRRIVGLEMSIPGVAEIHGHSHDNGMMRMYRVDSLEVPAKGERSFKPGGYHLMLMQLAEPLRPGERITLTLIYADGYRQAVEFPVQALMN